MDSNWSSGGQESERRDQAGNSAENLGEYRDCQRADASDSQEDVGGVAKGRQQPFTHFMVLVESGSTRSQCIAPFAKQNTAKDLTGVQIA
jgi:hypothetical protein